MAATDDIRERFYVISTEWLVRQPEVVAVTEGSRGTLFEAARAGAPPPATAS